MPAFNAGTAVEPIEYDFAPYVADCKGVVPEPSDEALRKFMGQLKEMGRKIRELTQGESSEKSAEASTVDESEDISAVLTFLETFDDDSAIDLINELAGYMAELCNQQPAYEDLMKLPWRVRNAFVGWLMGSLLNPESGTAGTSNSRPTGG